MRRRMDDTEAHARRYLEALGFQDIVHEPVCNQTPDFLVDGRIAVEVRRLSQAVETPDGPESLDQLAIPLQRKIAALLDSYGADPEDCRWFLRLRLSRPVAPWKVVERGLRAYLSAGLDDPRHFETRRSVAPGVQVSASPGSHPGAKRFELGTWADEDASGWVVEDMLARVTAAVDEKNEKIAKFFDAYPEWRLILEDRIAFSMTPESRRRFLERFETRSGFSQIILLNPWDPLKSFVIRD